MRAPGAGIVHVALAGLLVPALSGCSPQLRVVPGPSQGPIENERGVFEYRDGLVVSTVAVSQPPIGTGEEFVAFGIQIRNDSASACVIDVGRIQLGLGVGPQWEEKVPLPPDDLLRAFQAAHVSAPGFVELTQPELVRWRGGHGGRVCRYYGYRGYPYYAYPYGGYYGYPYYYDSGRDIYLQQQERAAFLARLLRSQEVPPAHVVGGFVVFPEVLHKGDDYRLLVPLYPRASATERPATTHPATAPAGGAEIFEFHFVAR